MEELLNVPYEERDEAWEAAFFKELPECQFDLLSDSPIQGPDGLPYLAVEIVDQGEPAKDIFDWLGEKGVGLAVNPNNEQPDYIFSYGMIWNFLVRDEFVTDAEVEGENGEVLGVKG